MGELQLLEKNLCGRGCRIAAIPVPLSADSMDELAAAPSASRVAVISSTFYFSFL